VERLTHLRTLLDRMLEHPHARALRERGTERGLP
jgi:hypothetical protein